MRLPARSHPWASTHPDVTFNLTTPSWTSAMADGGRYSLGDRRPRDTVSRVSPELTTVPSGVWSLSWTSQPRSMSANRNVRRGGPSGPPTIGERADARHLRSGPYDMSVTRARGLDGGCRVIGQSQIPGPTIALPESVEMATTPNPCDAPERPRTAHVPRGCWAGQAPNLTSTPPRVLSGWASMLRSGEIP